MTVRDVMSVKIFNQNATIAEIEEWIKSIDKSATIGTAFITRVNHEKSN